MLAWTKDGVYEAKSNVVMSSAHQNWALTAWEYIGPWKFKLAYA